MPPEEPRRRGFRFHHGGRIWGCALTSAGGPAGLGSNRCSEVQQLIRAPPRHPQQMCVRSLKSSLVGKGGGGCFPPAELKQDIRLRQLLGGSGRGVDRECPARRIGNLTLLGQEGLGGARRGAATQTGFHRQPLEVQTLRVEAGRDGEKLSLRSQIENSSVPRYLVVPRCDDHLLFVFPQPGLLTLTLQVQTGLRFCSPEIRRRHEHTSSPPDWQFACRALPADFSTPESQQ